MTDTRSPLGGQGAVASSLKKVNNNVLSLCVLLRLSLNYILHGLSVGKTSSSDNLKKSDKTAEKTVKIWSENTIDAQVFTVKRFRINTLKT